MRTSRRSLDAERGLVVDESDELDDDGATGDSSIFIVVLKSVCLGLLPLLTVVSLIK